MSTLVILERDTLLRRSLHILLEVGDHAVVEVATGDGALKVMRKLAEPCVLVLHHRLPEADALPMLIRVANDPDLVARHRVVVIPSLGSPLHQPLPAAFDTLDVRIVPMPYDLHTLRAVVDGASRPQPAPGARRDTLVRQAPPPEPRAASSGERPALSPRVNPSANGAAPPPDPMTEREFHGDGGHSGARPA